MIKFRYNGENYSINFEKNPKWGEDEFFTKPHGWKHDTDTTGCELTLPNGIGVLGLSVRSYKDTHDPEKGRKVALKHAMRCATIGNDTGFRKAAWRAYFNRLPDGHKNRHEVI